MTDAVDWLRYWSSRLNQHEDRKLARAVQKLEEAEQYSRDIDAFLKGRSYERPKRPEWAA